MDPGSIVKKLQGILNKADIDRDSPITRAKSVKHSSQVEVLIQHVEILVAELRHDAEASKRELFQVRNLLEFDDYDLSG